MVEPLIEPNDALMEEVPVAIPLNRPERFTVATDELDEFHVAVLVKSCIVPSA